MVDKRGQRLYEMPRLTDPYIAVNREGTRFVVHERDSSFLGQFNDTTDRKRMTVFRSSDEARSLNIVRGKLKVTALMMDVLLFPTTALW